MSENYYHSSKNFWSDEREERKKVDKGIDVLSEIDKKLQKAFEILETDEYGLMETSSYDGIEEEIENCRELNNKAWDYASMIHEVLDEKEEVFHKALSKALEEISLININDYEVENTLGIQEFYTAANTTGNYNYQGNNKNTVTTERLKEKITFSDIMAKTDTYHLKEQFQKYLTDEKKNMKMMSDVEIAKYKEDFYDMVFTTSFDHEVYSNLGGVSEFLDYIPVIGGIKSLGEAISGYTMSGEKLKTNERVTQGVLGTLSVVVDVFTLGAISVAAKGTKAIATGIGKFTASDIIAGYSTKYTSEAMSDLGASPELIMGTHILTGLAVGKYTNYKSEMNSIKRLAGLDNLEQVKDMMKYSNLSAKELENLLKKSSIESILGVDKMNLVNKLKEGASGANQLENLTDFKNGTKSFDDVIDDYAKAYADKIKSNSDWSWNKSIVGGEKLSIKQKRLIKETAVKNGYIPEVKVTKAEGMKYGFADFEPAGAVKHTEYLPKEMWKSSDSKQFEWLNNKIGGKVEGYTWHHTEVPGKMQLVETGVHNITTHNGGRTAGMWADAPR